MARPRPLLVLAAGALALVPACGDDDEPVASTTSTTPAASEGTTSSAPGTTADPSGGTTTSLGTTATTSPVVPATSISTAVYWTRPAGTPRPIDVPAYRDPDGGPYPFVLYGSVTNTGDAAVDTARIRVDWVAGGATVHTSPVRVVDAAGTPIGALQPGQSADAVVVVDDEAVASGLPDAVPTFGVSA